MILTDFISIFDKSGAWSSSFCTGCGSGLSASTVSSFTGLKLSSPSGMGEIIFSMTSTVTSGNLEALPDSAIGSPFSSTLSGLFCYDPYALFSSSWSWFSCSSPSSGMAPSRSRSSLLFSSSSPSYGSAPSSLVFIVSPPWPKLMSRHSPVPKVTLLVPPVFPKAVRAPVGWVLAMVDDLFLPFPFFFFKASASAFFFLAAATLILCNAYWRFRILWKWFFWILLIFMKCWCVFSQDASMTSYIIFLLPR